jgi:hypothetical protein
VAADDDPQADGIELITGLEEQLGLSTKYLVVPEQGVAYVQGTILPLIGGPSAQRVDTSPLRVPGSRPASDDYVGTYVTLDEYLPGASGLSLQIAADEHRRKSLLVALVTLNRFRDDPAALESLTEAFVRSLVDREASERLAVQMKVRTGGMGRRIVGAQPLLLSIRWLLSSPPRSEPVADETTLIAAAFFSHLAASQLTNSESADADPRRLMLIMMSLGMMSEEDDTLAAMDRTLRLWEQHGAAATKAVGKHANEIFRDITGLEVRDVLAVGFALLAQCTTWKPGDPALLTREIHPNVPQELIDRALPLFTKSLDDHYGDTPMPASAFDTLAIETHPVLELPDGLLVLDERFLWRRCTTGLFHIVVDALKAQGGQATIGFRNGYGAMIESLVEESLQAVAVPILGTATSYYTEDDLEAAYGQSSRCDVLIDFGEDLMIVEIVSGQVSVQSRVQGDVDKLEQDIDRLVLQKCKQLDNTAQNVLADEEPLTGVPGGTRTPTLVPVLIVGGGFPLNSLSVSYIRESLEALSYLRHSRVTRLSIVDLSDVEQLEALAEEGHSPVAILTEWQTSELNDVPLRNFLLRRYKDSPRRPSRMDSENGPAFDDLVDRLGLTDDRETTAEGVGT